MSHPRNPSTSNESMYVCSECPSATAQSFASAEELEIHVTGDHLAFFPFECEKCRFAKFPTEYALVSHCKNDHGLREFYVKYKITEDTERKRSAVRAILLRCMRGRGDSHHAQEHVSTSSNCEAESYDERLANICKRSCEDYDNGQVSSGSASHAFFAEASTSFFGESKGRQRYSNGNIHSPTVASGLAGSSSTTCNDSPHEGSPPLDYSSDLFPSLDFSASTGVDVGAALLGSSGKKRMAAMPKEALVCQLCGLKVTNQRSSLVYHANTKHAKLNLYKCRQCEKTWQTIAKSDVLKHVKAVHDGDDSLIEDNRKALSQDLKELTNKCFPPRPTKRARLVTTDYSNLVLSGSSGQLSELGALKVEVDSTQSVLDALLAAGADFATDETEADEI